MKIYCANPENLMYNYFKESEIVLKPKCQERACTMTKASKSSLALSDSILDSDVSADFVAAVAKAPKAPRAKKVEAPKAEGEVGLTVRELAVIKAVALSSFADPVSGAVPSFTLAIEAEVAFGTVKGESKVNSPIPGLVASLQKKGVFETYKVKGQTMVALSPMGKEYVEAIQ